MIWMIRTVRIIAAMLMMQQSCLADTATTATLDDVAVLEAALRARYPQVTRWQVAPASSVQHKRRPKLFAQLDDQVEVRRDGNVFFVYSRSSSQPIRYRVAGYQQVNVAAKYLPSNHTLLADSTSQVERDVLSLGCDPLVGRLSESAWRLQRAVKAQEVLCAKDVEAQPLIVRNDAVVIRCARGPVTAAVAGVALSDGTLGETIHVRWNGRYKTSRAAVVQKGEVNACI